MKSIVLASNNAKKMNELNALLAPLGFEVIAQGQLGIPEAEEPHCTFVENALAKARHAAKLSGLPALADDPQPLIAEGEWHGEILPAARGESGFGYDPLFYVRDFDCSAAELDAATKNRLSHRGQAMQKLIDRLPTL